MAHPHAQQHTLSQQRAPPSSTADRASPSGSGEEGSGYGTFGLVSASHSPVLRSASMSNDTPVQATHSGVSSPTLTSALPIFVPSTSSATDTVTLAPFRPHSALGVPHPMGGLNRNLANRSASPQPTRQPTCPPQPFHRGPSRFDQRGGGPGGATGGLAHSAFHQKHPTVAAAPTGQEEPLLPQFNLDDDAQPAKGAHPLAAPVQPAGAGSTTSSTAPASSSGQVPAGANPYYDQYEATVSRIRARRAAEHASREKLVQPTPEQVRTEYHIIFGSLFAVVLIAALLIFFLYPRVPQWTLQAVHIDTLRLWSDGTAALALTTHVGVSNGNFLMTGIDSLSVSVAHRNTSLGLAADMGALKWPSRRTSEVVVQHSFMPMDGPTFANLFEQLATPDNQGTLTLTYTAAISTSENFRLRNMQVHCTANLHIDPLPVPPQATILQQQCTHTEQTG